MSLRDELIGGMGADIPPFVLLLPPGWISVEPSKQAFSDLMASASSVLRQQHRPELDARLRALVDRAADDFLRRDPVRLIYQNDVPSDRMLPMSITVARTTAPGGGNLDAQVEELVRARDARPLDGARFMMRWSVESTRRIDGAPVRIRSFDYLVAIPGTDRRQALLFSAVILSGAAGEELESEDHEQFGALADAIMSTFRWSGA